METIGGGVTLQPNGKMNLRKFVEGQAIAAVARKRNHGKRDYEAILNFLRKLLDADFMEFTGSMQGVLTLALTEFQTIERQAGDWCVIRCGEHELRKKLDGCTNNATPTQKKYYWMKGEKRRFLKRELGFNSDSSVSLFYIIQKTSKEISRRCASIPDSNLWLVMYVPSSLLSQSDSNDVSIQSPSSEPESPSPCNSPSPPTSPRPQTGFQRPLAHIKMPNTNTNMHMNMNTHKSTTNRRTSPVTEIGHHRSVSPTSSPMSSCPSSPISASELSLSSPLPSPATALSSSVHSLNLMSPRICATLSRSSSSSSSGSLISPSPSHTSLKRSINESPRGGNGSRASLPKIPSFHSLDSSATPPQLYTDPFYPRFQSPSPQLHSVPPSPSQSEESETTRKRMRAVIEDSPASSFSSPFPSFGNSYGLGPVQESLRNLSVDDILRENTLLKKYFAEREVAITNLRDTVESLSRERVHLLHENSCLKTKLVPPASALNCSDKLATPEPLLDGKMDELLYESLVSLGKGNKPTFARTVTAPQPIPRKTTVKVPEA